MGCTHRPGPDLLENRAKQQEEVMELPPPMHSSARHRCPAADLPSAPLALHGPLSFLQAFQTNSGAHSGAAQLSASLRIHASNSCHGAESSSCLPRKLN